jgi:nucleoside-diphosphate-sugar epimerase
MSVAVVKPWKTSRIGGARLLIVGCGDVGLRLLKQIQSKNTINTINAINNINNTNIANNTNNNSVDNSVDTNFKANANFNVLALGRTPILMNQTANTVVRFALVNLDDKAAHLNTLRRYAAIAPWVIYLAPPNGEGIDDQRMQRFLACAASPSTRIKKIIYVSTTGVYGVANGVWVNETSPLKAQEPRAIRRIAAERRLKNSAVPHVSILRAPGIYADDRLPIHRLKNRLPALIDADDVPTNHIHADDLARLCWLALFKSRNRRTYNVADGVPMMHAEYLKAVAQCFDLPAPVQLPREAVQAALSPIAWSMLSSARRVDSSRLRNEWRIQLQYPSMLDYLSKINIKNIKNINNINK